MQSSLTNIRKLSVTVPFERVVVVVVGIYPTKCDWIMGVKNVIILFRDGAPYCERKLKM